MSDAELQEEEREVLLSIYDGDVAFNQLNASTYQYKYGENDNIKSFLLEITWGPTYPTEKPCINMNTFYNKHIIESVKKKILEHVDAEAEQWLGTAMTYTLFQSVQENLVDLIAEQPESLEEVESNINKLSIGEETTLQDEPAKKMKKEQLTKAQKRRQWNRADGKGEKPRGWDWVDIVKHLSQTGSKPDVDT